jgi:anti-sigma regulatory factor (Ser/Thr protein kinase)
MEDSEAVGTLDLRVRAEAASLARVRALLTAFLSDQGIREDQQHNALLVMHELAANAIEHGSTDDEVEITIMLKPRSLLIRILDPARTGAVDESRRGLLIVGQIAPWTRRLHGGRREVTARLPLPP